MDVYVDNRTLIIKVELCNNITGNSSYTSNINQYYMLFV